MKFCQLVVLAASFVVALMSGTPAIAQLKRYAIITGDAGNVPDSAYRFGDADSGCVATVQVPPSDACIRNHNDMHSFLGPHPTQPSACVHTWDCLCDWCRIGAPDDPRNFNKISTAQSNAYGQPMPTCTGGTRRDFVACTVDSGKGKGPCPGGTCKGNPVNVLSQNKFQRELVYSPGAGDLELALWYNSQLGVPYLAISPFGTHWSSRYFVSVKDSLQGMIAVGRADGKELEFTAPPSGNVYLKDPDVNDTLERLVDGAGATTGWRLIDSRTDDLEEFDAAGRLVLLRNRAGRQLTMTYSTAATPSGIAPEPGLLITVTDHFGRQLNFTYNAQGRVAKLIDPAGGETLFEYDGPTGPAGAKNLTKITFPDVTTRLYHYAEAVQINGGAACASPALNLPNALTGLTDEKGARFASWTYDCSGRATGSEHAGGVERYTFTGNGTSVTYVDPLNTSHEASIASSLGVSKEASTSRPAASGSGTASNAATYDAQGNVSSRTDYNGNRTNFSYDLARNLETSRTEGLTSSGATTPQTRTVTTQWHATFRLRTGVAEPLRITTFSYDPDGTQCGARGALCSKSVQATTDANGSLAFSASPSGSPRTWAYTYNANGEVLTVNGPRTDVSDVTTYTYYADNDAEVAKRGRLASVVNAAGHTTSITAYNAHGQPLTVVDANGVTSTMTYDARQRLKTRDLGGEVTVYDYDGAGQLTKITLPDGSFLTYTYDDAHRLTQIQDNLGNRVVYTLDNMGNRTQEDVRDPANQLAQTRSRVFNNLNRLFRELGAQSQTTEYAYDEQGNVASVKDPLNRVTTNQYDALNRLKQVTSPTPISAVIQYAYNGLDALTQVTDPRGLATGYAVDGLGNLNTQTSPDTGTTSNTYDAAGNLLTQTDAKNQITTYTYDALNRVTSVTFHDGSKHNYTYDAGTNGIGRPTGIAELNPSLVTVGQIAYSYDQKGRVTSEVRTINGVAYTTGYRYDSSGRMDRITYPSGRTVDYGFDAAGRIGGVITTPSGGNAQTVASSVTYHPFGGVRSFALGNGQTYTRSYDQDGRIASYTLGGADYTIGYDAASRIGFITETANPPNFNSYGYDNLDRVTSATLQASAYSYSYDAVGNRLTRSTGGNTHTYEYGTTSNRVASITPQSGPVRSFTLDNNGSTTADGVNTYAYDTRGRMVQAVSSLGTTTYHVNALGQRVRKTNSLGDTVYHYDRGGRLIAESTVAGVVKREYLYLGDIPLAVVVLP